MRRQTFFHTLAAAALVAALAACSDTLQPVEGPDGPLDGTDDDGIAETVPDLAMVLGSKAGALRPGPSQKSLHKNAGPLALYPLDTSPGVYDPYKQNLAQTFHTSADASLEYAYFPVACVRDVLLRLQIRTGGPTGPVIWDRNYDVLHTVADGTWIAFQIYGGLPLRGRRAYSFVLGTAPRSGAAGNTCSILPGPFGDPYPGGQAFMNNPGYTPYWVDALLTDLGGVSAIMGDLPFATRIR